MYTEKLLKNKNFKSNLKKFDSLSFLKTKFQIKQVMQVPETTVYYKYSKHFCFKQDDRKYQMFDMSHSCYQQNRVSQYILFWVKRFAAFAFFIDYLYIQHPIVNKYLKDFLVDYQYFMNMRFFKGNVASLPQKTNVQLTFQ